MWKLCEVVMAHTCRDDERRLNVVSSIHLAYVSDKLLLQLEVIKVLGKLYKRKASTHLQIIFEAFVVLIKANQLVVLLNYLM